MTETIRNSKGQFVKGCKIATLNKGIKKPEGFGEKVSLARKGIKLSEITKEKISIAMQGNKRALGNKSHTGKFGEKSPNWIKDRGKIKIGDRTLNDPLQKQWSREVKNRDKWNCRIADENCSGRLEAHHILPWSEFPEPRYKVNNGITLCRHHHPKKKVDVVKLSPYFQILVASSDQNR